MTTSAKPSSPSNVPLVLVVDDEPKLRQAIAQGLRLENWSVEIAQDGAEAMRLTREWRFDLVVLDWMLPDSDGLELLRWLRGSDPNLPVVMITARKTRPERHPEFGDGNTALLAKPFAFDRLVACCRSLLKPVPSIEDTGARSPADNDARSPLE
jgi:DNA-binding response OmpR family regulator